jgi:serine phosphatase RsbU (regulator of sigma subunit)
MRRGAMVTTPLKLGDRTFGALSAMWLHERVFGSDELVLIDVLAAQCAQALARIELAGLQRASTFKVRRLAEELQRSLLTLPTTPGTLEIAVRYRPAAEEAKIGGDWYDAFVTASGATILVIGDVTGHDGMAAAAMGQLRNMLRGIAYDNDEGPAALLTRLDRAMAGLEVDVIASAIVAVVEPSRIDRRSGRIRLRWSNAGHPAPLLRSPDGVVRVLGGANDLLLGIEPATSRVEQVIELVEGSTLLLYTDGLVERRGTDFDDQVQRVARVMRDVTGGSAEGLCAALIGPTGATETDDDVALLALHCRPVGAMSGEQVAVDTSRSRDVPPVRLLAWLESEEPNCAGLGESLETIGRQRSLNDRLVAERDRRGRART